MGKRGLSGLVEIALYALMVVAFGLTITLPWERGGGDPPPAGRGGMVV